VGEPFGAGPGDLAGLRVGAVGGGTAAELIDPGRLDRPLPLVQVCELLIGVGGVGGEGAGGGAVADAIAARRGRGGRQVENLLGPSLGLSSEISPAAPFE